MMSLAIAVVAVMSVQPTSENLTVLQLSESPAKAMLAPPRINAAEIAIAQILILFLPNESPMTARAERLRRQYRRARGGGQTDEPLVGQLRSRPQPTRPTRFRH